MVNYTLSFYQSSNKFHFYETEPSCIDGQVRLVNGSIAQTGRVEVCVDGVWGSVCDVGWTKSDAFVVCKQLGYVNSGKYNN